MVSPALEGINERTPRYELLQRVRELAAELATRDQQDANNLDSKIAKLQEIEERVRASWVPNAMDIKHISIGATEEEWRASYDFLDNWADFLPRALQNMQMGIEILLNGGAASAGDEEDLDADDAV